MSLVIPSLIMSILLSAILMRTRNCDALLPLFQRPFSGLVYSKSRNIAIRGQTTTSHRYAGLNFIAKSNLVGECATPSISNMFKYRGGMTMSSTVGTTEGDKLSQTTERALHNNNLSVSAKKLSDLRVLFDAENIDAFIVPSDDPHMSEYTPLYYNRREYVSGFTGSAGTAVVLRNEAALFTDGRYHNQASIELDSSVWTLMKQGLKGVPSPTEYLQKTLHSGAVVGIDPWVHNADMVKRLIKAMEEKGINVKLLSSNLIDQIWNSDREPLSPDAIRIHDLAYGGLSVSEKLASIRKALNASRNDALVVSSLDEVAWLFNLRGSDVPCNPVFLSYAFVTHDNAYIFIDEKKVPAAVQDYLTQSNVTIMPYNSLIETLYHFQKEDSKKIFMDTRSVNYAIYSAINEKQRNEGESPIIGLKAVKNNIELKGMKQCHIRDGAAVAEFLAWLDELYTNDPEARVDEYEIDIELTKKRMDLSPNGWFLDRSFPTIAGVDSNGAIIHYRAPKEGCKVLGHNSLLLLDSGAQYLDGTTDVTRTFHMGTPSPYQIEMFTRVLKGHIAIDRSVFPAGTPGCLIDSYAREHLWRIGKDFIHGVGHGVGAALNVHEGPHRISRVLDNHAFIPGMIISNEPGYYEDGNFGIRIENLLIVTENKELPEFAGRKFYGFERLTHIPIQTKLIDKTLLNAEEINWMNRYHKDVYDKVSPLLVTDRARIWLQKATQPI